ncbi:hypothetical protein BXZ70DRAFT_895237 [Cristinia sonorae]|uniref:Uncharacterized protein n=1 Tax=Cristinia sonorae TaxID=1940300 RepID=A0A8K0UN31_9AGAR|nr:hypothetical protein BXZ70DRAFT_895237 [Cristinia sonorae]
MATSVQGGGYANETSLQVFADKAVIYGVGLGFIGYGVLVTLYFQCLELLWKEKKNASPRSRQSWILLSYITLLFVIGSIENGVNMFGSMDTFVINRDYPGGPGQFEQDQFALHYKAIGYVVSIIGFWLADGLMVFRFCTVFGTKWWKRLLPIVLYVASIATSIMLLHAVLSPNKALWFSSGFDLLLAYCIITITINVLLTFSIVLYLVYMRFTLRKTFGPSHTSPYFSISAMLIESALLLTVFTLAYLVPTSKHSSVGLIFVRLLPQIQLIAPLLIILRVAHGRAWTRATAQLTMHEGGTMGRPSISFMSAVTTTAVDVEGQEHRKSLHCQCESVVGSSHTELVEEGKEVMSGHRHHSEGFGGGDSHV